jgi:hypothetical protein
MKTNKFLLTGILGIALAGVVLTGCHKASTAPDTDVTAAEDESSGQYVSNDAKNVSDNAVSSNGSNYGLLHRSIGSVYSSNCTVTWSDTTKHATTVTVTVSFGASPFTTPVYCNDGKYRQGQITISWPVSSGQFFWEAYFTNSTEITQTFNGYKVGATASTMNGVSGTRTWTNAGHDTAGYENWNFNADLTITRYTGKIFTWKSTRNNTLINIGGTWYYEITGSATGTTETGVVYTLSITSPLYITAEPWWLPNGCPYIESGVISINRSSSSNTLSINFGTLGTCSSTCTATLNGNTYTITKWW